MLNQKVSKGLLVVTLCLSTGCASLVPQWRVGQAVVPPPTTPPPTKIEGERKAATLIAEKIETPAYLKPVAIQLAASLGPPKERIEVPQDKPETAATEATQALAKGQKDLQARLDKLNATLTKYQGKEIEDTGVNLFGPIGGLAGLGLIAACIFLPGFLTFLLFFIRRLRATITSMVQGVSQFSEENPEEAEKLKGSLSRTMDAAHKAVVRATKAKLASRGA